MIEPFTTGMRLDDFRDDPKTVAAVERELQIVSEAAIRLGSGAESSWRELPRRDIRDIGNRLPHQYEHIELSVPGNTIRKDLPRLKLWSGGALVCGPD